LKRIYFTVTNDLNFDQRMHRICGSLAEAGFKVTLVGRKMEHSKILQKRKFHQKRLKCLFNKGFLFYAEYNIRLFFFLLFRKMDLICAIDLDTILPCLWVSRLRRLPRVYDAHEYFTEMKEVRTRPFVRGVWRFVERISVPAFHYGYTVSEGLVKAFRENYKRDYLLVRNLPVLRENETVEKKYRYILYQGAVNEGRGLEYLIPAMRKIDCQLQVCGDGNFMPKLKRLIKKYGVKHKVELMGMLFPEKLRPVTEKALLGIALAEKDGINQFYALPNKFFDYMHAGLPQLTMNFPEYEKINQQYKVAVLMNELSVDEVVKQVNELLNRPDLLEEMEKNCLEARKVYCWQNEQKVLVSLYKRILDIE